MQFPISVTKTVLILIYLKNNNNIRYFRTFLTYKRASVSPDKNRGIIVSWHNSLQVATPLNGSKCTKIITPVPSANANKASPFAVKHDVPVCGKSKKEKII